MKRKSRSPGTGSSPWEAVTVVWRSAELPREGPKPCRRHRWEEDLIMQWDHVMHGRKTFTLLLCTGEALEASGRAMGRNGTSTASVSGRVWGWWESAMKKITWWNWEQIQSLEGRERKSVQKTPEPWARGWGKPGILLEVLEECGRWEEWGGVNICVKAYLSLPGLFAKHSRAKSMFARCQLPINQPLAAVLLPASLPEGEGRTDSKGFVCSVVVWQRLWTAGGLQMLTA